MVIRESSDFDNTSMDDELDGDLDDGENIIGAMLKSNDNIDKQLVNVYKVRKIKELRNYREMHEKIDRTTSTIGSDLIL